MIVSSNRRRIIQICFYLRGRVAARFLAGRLMMGREAGRFVAKMDRPDPRGNPTERGVVWSSIETKHTTKHISNKAPNAGGQFYAI